MNEAACDFANKIFCKTLSGMEYRGFETRDEIKSYIEGVIKTCINLLDQSEHITSKEIFLWSDIWKFNHKEYFENCLKYNGLDDDVENG